MLNIWWRNFVIMMRVVWSYHFNQSRCFVLLTALTTFLTAYTVVRYATAMLVNARANTMSLHPQQLVTNSTVWSNSSISGSNHSLISSNSRWVCLCKDGEPDCSPSS